MSDDKFDAIVVGAGPAGTSAAITLARAGLNAVLLERGEYPGSKNVQGAVLYTKMLDEIVPKFWEDPEAALERPVTDERMWVMSEDSAAQFGFKTDKWRRTPHNCYTIIRVNFDRWYAKKAEEAGAQVFTGVTVRDCVKENGKVVGIKTSDGDELRADAVIACDGVNSLLAQKLGLIDEWKADEVALGVKEVLHLPKEKIEDRFCLEPGDGATIEMFGGGITRGMLGYAFLYTNKETLALGVGCKLSHFQKSGVRPYDLLESVKRHPMVRRLIQDAKPAEYSAHLIPEGGYHSMPPLCADGFLVAGDAAQMVNAAHREGSNLAMSAGRLAAETVIEAKKAGDFSARTLSAYQEKLKNSFIIPDLYEVRDLEHTVEENMGLLNEGPELLSRSLKDFFDVDGRPRAAVIEDILRRAARNGAVNDFLKKQMTPKNALKTIAAAVKAGLKFQKMRKG